MKRTALRTFLLLVTTIVLAPACLAQSDDFNDGNDTGWTRYDPLGTLGAGPQATYSFPNGGYRIQASRNPALSGAGPARGGSYRTNEYSDFFITADIVNWDDSMDQAIGLLARITRIGLGTTDGYALTYQPPDHDVTITHFTGEGNFVDIPLLPSSAITMVPGRSYRYVWIGKGIDFTVRIYELPNLDTPVLEATGSDTSINPYTNGLCGFLAFDNSTGGTAAVADATFDNYFATKSEPIPPPPLFIDRTIVEGTVVISWSTNLTGFVLQAAPNVSTPSSMWTDLTDPIFVNEQTGRYEYYEFTSGTDNLFFRLRRPPD